jgi:N4-gp56 family major capsid protein
MAYTGTSALSALVQGAVDTYVRGALRSRPLWRVLADVFPEEPTAPGSSATLHVYSDLAVATTPLNEITDPTEVALPSTSTVVITPAEYGNLSITTAKVRGTAFTDIPAHQMDQMAFNMANSLDVLVSGVLNAGTNVTYSGTGNAATADVANGDIITTANIAKAVTELRSADAHPRMGELFMGLVHPRVAHDIRRETGEGGWRDAHKYAAPDVFWPATTGVYEGVAWTETNRAKFAADGTTSEPVYRTLILGKEALAEAVVEGLEPGLKVGVVPDAFGRFRPLGWYGYLGWARFREAAIQRIESATSLT